MNITNNPLEFLSVGGDKAKTPVGNVLMCLAEKCKRMNLSLYKFHTNGQKFMKHARLAVGYEKDGKTIELYSYPLPNGYWNTCTVKSKLYRAAQNLLIDITGGTKN